MKNQHQPAFPCEPLQFVPGNKDLQRVSYPGMTLRDYFAAHALAGMLRDPAAVDMSSYDVAMASYAYADAMLKARAE